MKRDEIYQYDEKVLDALSGRNTWQPSNINQGATNSSVSSEVVNVNDICPCGNPGNCKGWSDIYLPLVSNIEPTIESAVGIVQKLSTVRESVSLSQPSEQTEHSAISVGQSANVNIESSRKRVNSSTSGAFLDNLDTEGNPFLSVESSSGMSGDESHNMNNFKRVNNLNEGDECGTPTESQLASQLMATLRKVDSLADDVKSFKDIVVNQSSLIQYRIRELMHKMRD